MEFFDNSIICNLIENVSCPPGVPDWGPNSPPSHLVQVRDEQSLEQPRFDGAAAQGRGCFGVTLSITAQSKCGILAMLDEECLRPGVVNEDTFLTKLNQLFATHKHYESKETQNARRVMDASLPPQCFRIHHYAGKVCQQPRSPTGTHSPSPNRGSQDPWVHFPALHGSCGAGLGKGSEALNHNPLSPSSLPKRGPPMHPAER